jgi:hypothetical protein
LPLIAYEFSLPGSGRLFEESRRPARSFAGLGVKGRTPRLDDEYDLEIGVRQADRDLQMEDAIGAGLRAQDGNWPGF